MAMEVGDGRREGGGDQVETILGWREGGGGGGVVGVGGRAGSEGSTSP